MLLLGMDWYPKCVHLGLRILFYTPKQTWTFPLHDIAIKVVKCTKYQIKAYNFFRFLVCSQYFKFEVAKCHNQNMAVLFYVIASAV